MTQETEHKYTADNLSIFERKILARSDDMKDLSSKERILKFAIKNFATHGYEKTSIRSLASEANVNISSISYYFRDKEGLYEAAMDLISKRLQLDLLPVIKNNNKLLSEKMDNQEEIEKISYDTISKVVYYLINDEISPYVSKILLREYLSPSNKFDDYYKKALFPIHNEMATFFANLARVEQTQENIVICSHALY